MFMRFALSALAAIAALALSACSTTETASTSAGADCFTTDQVTGYSVIDDSHVRVNARAHQYVLTIQGRATELDWTQTIGLQSTGRTLICPGRSTTGVYLVGGDTQLRYPVSEVALEERAPTGS
jgi:hypothetical protein